MKNKEMQVIILNAQDGDEKATLEILNKYQNMIKAYSFINGELKEELKQDLTEITINCIKKFKV